MSLGLDADNIAAGPKLDGESLYKLMSRFRVNNSAGVPTVCAGLLQHCDEKNLVLDSLESICIGGAACPPAMIKKFADRHGVTVRHLWGAISLPAPKPFHSFGLPSREATNFFSLFMEDLKLIRICS